MRATYPGPACNETINHAAPTLCMKVPMSETRSAISRLRNVGTRSGRPKPADFPTIEPFPWAMKSIYARFLRHSRRTFEKTSGQRSKGKPSDVGQISHTASLHLRDRSCVHELREEPKTN